MFFLLCVLPLQSSTDLDLGGLVAHLAGTLTQLRSLLPEAEATQEVRGDEGSKKNGENHHF